MAGHISSELKALAELADHLISGDYLEVEETFEYNEGGTKVTAMPVYRNLVEYLFTIEETSDTMMLAVRSTRIPELFITLPAPLIVKFGAPQVLEEMC
jgi:hypothetical protein